jgi:hypothetical protein
MVWSAIASFGSKLLQGAQGLRGIATVAGGHARVAYQSGGIRTAVSAFRDGARVQWSLAGPAARSAMKTTAITAGSIPVAHGLLNSGSGNVPQGYPSGYRTA